MKLELTHTFLSANQQKLFHKVHYKKTCRFIVPVLHWFSAVWALASPLPHHQTPPASSYGHRHHPSPHTLLSSLPSLPSSLRPSPCACSAASRASSASTPVHLCLQAGKGRRLLPETNLPLELPRVAAREVTGMRRYPEKVTSFPGFPHKEKSTRKAWERG